MFGVENKMSEKLVTVITASCGRPALIACIESVAAQTYSNIQHLIFCDGADNYTPFQNAINRVQKFLPKRLDVVHLPYSIGKDRWNGHRMYGAGTYIADGDFVIFLDDDNTLDPDHVQQCMDVIANPTPPMSFH